MKKEWLNPEVKNLGVEATREGCGHTDECESGVDKGLLIHMCDHCGRFFLTHCAEKEHEKNCAMNPDHKPVNPLPDGNEEDWIVPVS